MRFLERSDSPFQSVYNQLDILCVCAARKLSLSIGTPLGVTFESVTEDFRCHVMELISLAVHSTQHSVHYMRSVFVKRFQEDVGLPVSVQLFESLWRYGVLRVSRFTIAAVNNSGG